MAWHTIAEAQKLTGKSRRTLYRDMASGRISWAAEGDYARRLETSELIRVYGELKPVAQQDVEDMAQPGTHGASEISMILDELKALRLQVAELQQAMRLIEHKPEPELVRFETEEIVTKPAVPTVPWWRRLFYN